jgi:ADP-heptose:LPS heptosyltransferase
MNQPKILIIRFSSIGDIVWTTPVIRCLKLQMPEAQIHFATKKQYASILAENPYLTKIHCLGDKINELVQELKAENFDYVIDLHSNVRSRIIKWNLGKKSSTYQKYSWQRWLLVKFKINKVPADKHIADWYMDAVAPLGIVSDGKGLDYFIPAKDEIKKEDLPTEFRQGYVAFVIGASEFTKRLPYDKIIELCQKINEPLILIGGKEDKELGDRISMYFQHQPQSFPIFNACGLYNINQSASIVKNSKVVFGHDTGLTHIAAAFQKKIFGIYGGTLSQYLHPYKTDYTLFEIQDLPCRPCAKAGRSNCPKGHFKCMNDLNFEFDLSQF